MISRIYFALISFFIPLYAIAQETVADKVGVSLDSVTGLLTSYKGSIVTIGGIALVIIAKIVSNEKEVIVVKQIQYVVDLAAKLIVKVGTLLSKVSEILGDLIKSDGIGGVK